VTPNTQSGFERILVVGDRHALIGREALANRIANVDRMPTVRASERTWGLDCSLSISSLVPTVEASRA
jgi:hypothetical protein